MVHKLFSFLVTILVASFSTFAEPPKYGEISLEELSKSIYEADPSVEAEVIYDIGSSRFSYVEHFGFRLVYERKTRIKIYTKQGTSRANISVPYYIKDNYLAEMVSDIEGQTYNLENGQIIKTSISKKDVFETRINENWSKKSFALPNVREGSLIEFKYTIESPFYINLQSWQFQKDIPVRWSEYKAKIPGFFNYSLLKQGYIDFYKEEADVTKLDETVGPYTYKSGIYHWVLKDIPAFKDENFMTTADDYISKIEFQLNEVYIPGRQQSTYVSTWPELVKEMLKESDFGKNYGKITSEVKEITETIIAGKTSEQEKAVAIYDYILANFAWNEEFRRQPEKSVKKLLEEKTGNSTDLNLLLANMLQHAGIKETPVLLSTRSNGKIVKEYPYLHKFNNTLVFAEIGESQFLLDATDPFQPFGMIPKECLNGDGLIVDNKEPKWINLESNSLFFLDTRVLLMFDSTHQKLTAHSTRKYDGYAALEKRKSIYAKARNSNEVSESTGNPALDEVSDYKIKNLENFDEPLALSYSKQVESDQGSTNETIYLNPIFADRVTDNPFKSANRAYPIDYGFKQAYIFTASLMIPEGYEVEELPESTSTELKDGSVVFRYIVSQNSGSVQVKSQILVNKSLIQPEAYASLKDIYDQIVRKHAEMIVLKKK